MSCHATFPVLSTLVLGICILICTSTTTKANNFPLPFHRTKRRNIKCTFAFTSCPPPRFDNFLDSIVGTWSYSSTSSDDIATPVIATTKTSDVEEVMRSCGGAVQGVREIQYSGTAFDRMYHNRADDGFVYFDCGSYSAGPIHIQSNDEEEGFELDENVTFVSSLSSTESQGHNTKARTIITTSPKCSVSLIKDKPQQNKDGNNNIISDHPPCSIKWDQEILCRMASPSQPWMLQRAKWEKNVNENNVIEDQGEQQQQQDNSDDNVQSLEEESTSTEKSKNWICTYSPTTINNEEQQPWQSKELTSILLSSQKVSKIIQIGSTLDGKNVKAFLRCYNDEGNLKAVILQNGKCM